jgi:hypothetical protein
MTTTDAKHTPTFEETLIENAKKIRDEHLASDRPCCVKCLFSKPPNNPNHASHYVECEWIFAQKLPQHMNFGNVNALVGITGGENCLAFEVRAALNIATPQR